MSLNFLHPLKTNEDAYDFGLWLEDIIGYQIHTWMTSSSVTANTLYPYVFSPAYYARIRIAGAAALPVDVRPGVCPNEVALSVGTLQVAIAGSSAARAWSIAPASIRLAGVRPTSWRLGDVTRPYRPYIQKSGPIACTAKRGDGAKDLILTFATADVLRGMGGSLATGAVVAFPLTGWMKPAAGGKPFVGEDVVRIVAR